MEHGIGRIERGKILAKSDSGYTVASLDRTGIEIPDMKPIDDTKTYTIEEMVYFFAFNDGTGKIICSL